MPWEESRIVDQRLQFLSSYQKEEMSVSDLCREFGVSRPTGYRWINRYKEVGPEGLLDLSSKPHSCSHATPERTENAILALRSKYPSWGARKLKARLEQLDPSVDWASCQHVRKYSPPSRLNQSETEEAPHDSVLGTIFRGDSAESALVYGL
jgi:transposase